MRGVIPTWVRAITTAPLIMEAARCGHVEMIDLLLERGARIDATDDLNRSALKVAADNGQPDAVRKLLERGADGGQG